MRRVAGVLIVAFVASFAGAQDAPKTAVRVRIADSSGVRLEGAELTIVRGLHDTVATGQSASNGEWSVLVDRISSPYQLIARKIGFGRQQRFFMATGDSVVVAPRMGRIVQALAEVKITEKEDAKRKSYFIDADDIANSPRPLADASDILLKLRPDMIFGRAGRFQRDCQLSNIWVNGIAVFRDFGVTRNPGAPRGRGGRAVLSSPDPYIISDAAKLRAAKSNSGEAMIGAARLTLLEQIKPEHIQEISYKDCFDESVVQGNFSRNALYIVLKPGIKFEPGVGTYAIEGGRTAR